MIKLSLSHLAILASACSRNDALAIVPTDLKPAAAAKTGTKLVELGLAREVRAKGDMPAWREDEEGHAYSLKILKAGRIAVQAMTPAPEAASTSIGSDKSVTPQAIGETRVDAAKAGSKRALILMLLSRKEGVNRRSHRRYGLAAAHHARRVERPSQGRAVGHPDPRCWGRNLRLPDPGG